MLDLFSGIGGFSYAGEKLVGGYETVAFCEYDKHAQKVLRKHWPDTEIIDDVRELANDADRFRGLVDIVVGGYPCQPFSTAGKRRGDKDDRHLWPEMLRIIQAVRPTWVIGENVAGHITLGLDTVLSDLEGEGYQARCFVIPAVAADAPHRRDRCWIVAHADIMGDTEREQWGAAEARRLDLDGSLLDRSQGRKETDATKGSSEDVANADSERLEGGEWQGVQGRGERPSIRSWWEPEPSVGRVANGVPGRVHRLKQLGNSIVPQVAARILYAIREAHEQT
jgi:DNA (cytosine-5)-methyltransferase 1